MKGSDYFVPGVHPANQLYLRRTLVLQAMRRQGKEAIGNEFLYYALFTVHCSLMFLSYKRVTQQAMPKALWPGS